MLIKDIYNFIRGYIIIDIEGLSIEKYMNLAALEGIKMWDVRRTSYKTLSASISIKDFKTLREIQKTVRCNINIVRKKGLPFLIARLKRRKAWAFGMLFFLIFIHISSSFIWVIEIDDLNTIERERVENKIVEFGIFPGKYRRDIDIFHIESKMMMEFPEISWVNVELRGVKAIVTIVEAVSPPKEIDNEKPCNIIAQKAGVIHKMIVLEGLPTVEEEEMVEPGQLLVSGIIDHIDTTVVRYVHARGEILARTWYELAGEVDIEDYSHRLTGNVVDCKYIGLGEYIMDFNVEPMSFEKYQIKERREFFFGEGRFIPLEFIVREYHELELLPRNRAIDMAKEDARKKALSKVDIIIPDDAKIIDKTYKYDIIEDKRILCTLYAEAIEDIGIQAEIAGHGEDIIIE